MEAMVSWLSHGGPDHPKHRGWMHPICVAIFHYTVITIVGFQLHDWFFDSCGDHHVVSNKQHYIALFLVLYWKWLLIWRLFFREPINNSFTPSNLILYEYCWLCNGTLLQAALGFWSGRPLMASAYCVVIGIDQILWYVDIVGYLTTGKFLIGVCKYLFWSGNSHWKNRVTSTHHLWTIPLLLFGVGGPLPLKCFPLSFLYMSLNVILSRVTTPAFVRLKKEIYLNVNLSHALWKDIKFDILQINYDDPPPILYLFRLLWRWQGFNGVVFALLWLCCDLSFPRTTSYCAY